MAFHMLKSSSTCFGSEHGSPVGGLYMKAGDKAVRLHFTWKDVPARSGCAKNDVKQQARFRQPNVYTMKTPFLCFPAVKKCLRFPAHQGAVTKKAWDGWQQAVGLSFSPKLFSCLQD